MDNSMMATLRKLIAHEKSARAIGSTEEAEAFAAKIQELMFRHKLEMTDIEYAEQEQNEPVMSEFMSEENLTGHNREDKRRQGWASVLIEAVTRANFCRAVTMRGVGNGVTIFGRESDREAAKALFRYLYEACLQEAPRYTARHCTPEQVRLECERYNLTPYFVRQRFTSGFKLGFASGIAERLRTQNIALKAGAGEQGLVRIDQLEKAVDNKMHEQFEHLSSSKVKSTRGAEGFRVGKKYGSSIGINSTRRLGIGI